MLRRLYYLIKNDKLDEVQAYDKFFTPIVFIIMISISADALVEYNIGGISSEYFIKNLIIIGIILSAYLFYLFDIISNKKVLLVASYSILAGIMSSIYFRYNMIGFEFEPYFLKVEIILIILTFAIGVLVHPIHKIITILLNLVFILTCACIYDIDYPTEKFIFYAFMISFSGFAAFAVHLTFIRLNKNIHNAHEYITLQNTELKKNNESKNQLFKIIGHDLKTPFSQLRSLLFLIEHTDCTTEKKELTTHMHESIANGDRLLKDLLNWAKIESSATTVTLEIQEINSITDDVFDFFKNCSTTKNIRLEKHIDDNLTINLDAKMMETILRNLVSNAIKFSKSGSKVSVIAKEIHDEYCISVIDQGIGMNTNTLDSLFESGKTNSSKGTENEPGTGFGLSICKKLIENHNGAMRVSSVIGEGTTVDICLPKA